MTFPTGNRECECGACHRGFTSTEAFDTHRRGFRCLEPSSVGLWLATDWLWSTSPRNPQAEAARRHASGVALKQAQESPRNPPRSDAQGRPGATHTGRGSDAPAKRTDGPWEMRTADGHTATYPTADRAHAAATTRGLLPSDYRVTRKDTAA